MIQGNFHRSVGPESVRFSAGQFRFVVEALDRAGGNRSFGVEPIQQQKPMSAQRTDDLHHRLKLRAHRPSAPVLHERPMLLNPIRDSLDLHPVPLLRVDGGVVTPSSQTPERGAQPLYQPPRCRVTPPKQASSTHNFRGGAICTYRIAGNRCAYFHDHPNTYPPAATAATGQRYLMMKRIKHWRARALLLMTMAVVVAVMTAEAELIDESHPIHALFGNGGIYTAPDDGVEIVHTNADGTIWVATPDGRIRSGTWRLNSAGHSCFVVGGVMEDCWTFQKRGTTVYFEHSSSVLYPWELTIEEGRSVRLISDLQRSLFDKLTGQRVVVETESGVEYVHLYADGVVTVVQPDGSTKTGSWWFKGKEQLCDNANGTAECGRIVDVASNTVTVQYLVDGSEQPFVFRLAHGHQ